MFVVPAQMLLKLGMASVALVGGIRLIEGELSLITFFLFMLVVSRIYEPMSFSLQNLAAMNSLQVNIDRMNEINNCPEQSGSAPFAPNGYDICFENVSFAYNDGERVLQDVSFTARQGEVTALIGPSGGGKSTAAKLAARFWDVSQGRITIGGVDVKTVDPEKLLTAVSIVFQDVVLFNDTIYNNITIGKEDATREEIIAAAKLARCDEFIQRLPQGYDTVISEDGGNLSQGQKQLLCITRVMLCLPPMLILDEATSSIDTRTEIKISQAFNTMMKGRTSFIVAHRLSTIREADIILVMKDGNIIEQGNHETLLRKEGGFYAKLYNSQFEAVSGCDA